MKKLHITLIVILGILMLSLCGVLGFLLSKGTGHVTWFHVDVGNIDVKSIDVGNMETGNIETGKISVGYADVVEGVSSGSAQSGHLFNWDAARKYTLVLEEKIPAEDIRSLKVLYDATSNDVLFYQGTGEDIVVREYMSSEPDEQQISTVEKKGGELTIRGRRKNLISFFSFRTWGAYTEIYLPRDVWENLEQLQVKTVSGYILSEIPFYATGDFTVSTTSGDVFFPDVKAGRLVASSTSGDIRVVCGLAEKISVSTVSGDVMLDQAVSDMTLSTTSGDILLTKLEGELSASTTSGDISLGQVSGGVTLSTTSGAVRLEDGQGGLDAGSVSGDIRVDSIRGNFQMHTTSGMLSVAKGNGYGRFSSVSGDIRIFLEELNGDLNISTTSGTVDISLPKESAFWFRFDSTSGECRTFFDQALSFNRRGNKAEGKYGDGGGTVDVSTTSGDLTVMEY